MGEMGRWHRTVAVLSLALIAMVAGVVPASRAVAAQDPVSCQSTVGLQNGGFELPVVANGAATNRNQSQVPGWRTTATDGLIEIWRSHRGVAPGAGMQHVELNGTQASTLYQDVSTTPGQTLRWQLQHRGRDGTDVMAVVLGPPGGTLVSQGDLSDGNTAWGTHAGLYTVPAGQTTTRFGFRAISTAGNNLTVGNLLDSVSFGTTTCIVTTTTVATPTGGPSANINDVLTYTVTAASGGGNPAMSSVVSDVLPAGVTYVPGSIQITNGSTTTARTDAAGDDQAEYDAGTRTVRAWVGAGATAGTGGAVPPGEARSVTYRVRVDRASAGSTVVDDAITQFVDAISGQVVTSTSGETSAVVAAAADLQASVLVGDTLPVAGTTNQVVATVTNAGPSPSPGTSLRTTLPSVSGLSHVAPGGACTVSGLELSCDFGTLAVGQSRTVTVSYDLPPDLAPGTVGDVTTSASGDRYDPALLDNTATVSTRSTASADVTLAMTHSPTVPVAGTDVTYTVVVGNDGPSMATGITVTNPVATGSSNVRATVAGTSCGTVGATNTVSCPIAQLAPGATTTVLITVTLAPGGSGEVNNEAFVTAETPDPDATNNAASVQSAGAADADLEVDLLIFDTANPTGVDSGFPGDTADYRLVITNHGPSTATNVSFQTVVPPGIIVNRAPNPYCTPTACTLPGLAPGQVVTITGTVTVSASAPAGPGRATTTIVSPTPDSNPVNDTATIDFEILLSADLAVSQTVLNADDATAATVAGRPFVSAVTVANAGPTRAEGVTVRQSVPTGQPVPAITAPTGACLFEGEVTAGIALSGGTVVCRLDVLAAGDTWTFELLATLPSSWPNPTFTRVRVVTASSPDPVSANDTHTISVPVLTRSDLVVSQTTDTPAVLLTDEVRFRVLLRNDGPSDVRNVLVRQSPGPGMAFLSATPGAGSYSANNGNWFLSSLPAGATVHLDVVGTAAGGASAINTATVLSAVGTDPDPVNNTADGTAVVVLPQDLTVTVDGDVLATGLATGAEPGDRVRWRYTVVNTSSAQVTGLLLDDGTTGTIGCDTTVLPPRGLASCSSAVPQQVTEADLLRGSITRQARASAHLAGNPLRFQSADANGMVSTAAPTAGLTVVTRFVPGGSRVLGADAWPAPVTVQTVSSAEFAAAASPSSAVLAAAAPGTPLTAAEGDLVAVLYTVTNTGNVTLTDVTVSDRHHGTVSCPASTLAPGTSMRCRAAPDHRVTAADLAAGRLFSAARVRGTPPGGMSQTEVHSDGTTESELRASVTTGPVARSLPRTGTDVDVTTGLALGLLLSGAVACLLGRPRTTSPARPVRRRSLDAAYPQRLLARGVNRAMSR